MQTKTFLLNELNKNNIENIFNINFDTVALEMPFEYKYFIAQDNESKLITFKYLANKIEKVKVKLTKSLNKNFSNKIHYYLQFSINN